MRRLTISIALMLPVVLGADYEAGVALPTDVPMAGASFPGAPPAFKVPLEGSVEVAADATGGMRIHLRRGDGTLFATAIIDQRGRTLSGLFYDSAGEVVQVTNATRGETAAAPTRSLSGRVGARGHSRLRAVCGANSKDPHPWRIDPATTFFWSFNANSTPSHMSVDTTETYLRNGHAQWYNNTNHCSIGDESVFGMAYDGRTTAGYGDNEINTVGFGDMGEIGCSGSLGCTRTEMSNGIVTESDTRFERSIIWVNGRAIAKYDTWGAMAHELGHTLGFADLTDSTDNVMYEDLTANDVSNQRLGRGDANGNNDKY